MRLILFSFFLTACFQDHKKITVKNESDLHFDKITIEVKRYSVKLKDIAPKTEASAFFSDWMPGGHDVIYSFLGYVKDSLRLKAAIYSNDLGHIPDSMVIKITDSLTVENIP